ACCRVSRASYIAVILIALLCAFSASSMTVGVGPRSIIEESQVYGPDLVFNWSAQHSPVLGHFATLLFVTSLLAVLLAFHNATARDFFAFGRSRVLPSALAHPSISGASTNVSIRKTTYPFGRGI